MKIIFEYVKDFAFHLHIFFLSILRSHRICVKVNLHELSNYVIFSYVCSRFRVASFVFCVFVCVLVFGVAAGAKCSRPDIIISRMMNRISSLLFLSLHIFSSIK